MPEELLHKHFAPFVAKKGEEYMSERQLAHFRHILETLKAELMNDIERTVHTMQDEATVFADPNDRASQETDIAIELRNRDRERKLIRRSRKRSRTSTAATTATAAAAASRSASSASKRGRRRRCASIARRLRKCANGRSPSRRFSSQRKRTLSRPFFLSACVTPAKASVRC